MDRYDTLLISSSSQENRQLLRGILEARFNLLEASSPGQALLLLGQNSSCIASVLMDISGLDADGVAMLGRQETKNRLYQVPVIVMCREDTPKIVNMAFASGAADVIPLGYEPYAMLRRIETIVQLHLHKQNLEDMVEKQARALHQSSMSMVDALSSIIEYRSAESGQHILRIRKFTQILLEEVARCCPEYGLTEAAVSQISNASALHDVGKIAIPDAVLLKEGLLTEKERALMKSHTLTGGRILQTLGDMGNPEYMGHARDICLCHHERWDGGGYPEGLKGDEIPISAQVVGLADAFDALTTRRVYKEAIPIQQAVNMIVNGECGAFSPKLMECFKHVVEDYEKLAWAYADGMSPGAETVEVPLPVLKGKKKEGLEQIRAKYNALVHFIDGLLIEMNLNRGIFHVVYNPHPELGGFQDVSTISEVQQILMERMIHPRAHSQWQQFFQEEIPRFVEEDLRRSTRYFPSGGSNREGDLIEVTLLRISPAEVNRRSVALLCRRVKEKNVPRQEGRQIPYMSYSTLLCQNDEHFTLVRLHSPRLAGYSFREISEQKQNRLTEMILPEDREKMRRELREGHTKGRVAETEFRIRHKDGRLLWIQCRAQLSLGTDGKEYLNCFLSDITKSRSDYDALQDRLHRYEIILAQTENVLFEWDIQNKSIIFSDTWEKIFGYAPQHGDIHDMLSDGSYFHPDDLPLLIDSLNELENGSNYQMTEVRLATARGSYLWCRFRATAVRDEEGKLQKIVGIVINIHAEKQAEQRLQDRAERDSLTKLLNKKAARKKAEEYLTLAPRETGCALLIIDLDNFKQINDRYGHLFGDAVLTRAAREIEKQFRSQDIVSRIGGDEFLVFMRGISDRALLEDRCQRLLQVFETLFSDHHQKIDLSCSIGVALSPEHGSTYVELFERADQALYRAKANQKKGYRFYEENDDFPVPRADLEPTVIDSDQEPGLADSSIVQYAFRQLRQSADLDGTIREVLSLIGRKMNVSRVYVFENSDDNRFCSNTYEWCNQGIKPQIHNLQDICYETELPGYEENFDEQGIFYCPDVINLKKELRRMVSAQQIRSMLQCAIRVDGVFRGYIGFDECVERRFWTKEQIHTLSYFSEVLSVFLQMLHRQRKAAARVENLRTILDHQNAFIYVTDPDTCRLKYVNAKVRQLVPRAQPGMYCYQALQGKVSPCEDCPSRNIRQDKNASGIVKMERTDTSLLAEAALIQWEGRDACMMICR